MTLLDGSVEGDDYKEESVSAMLSLLSMGIKTVPRAVLQLKFADASKILMGLLSKYAQSSNNVIMRSVSLWKLKWIILLIESSACMV